MTQAQRIVLASRPVGEPKPDNFRLENIPLPVRGPGQMLLRTVWLSLDPYMRGRMSDAPSYAPPVRIDDVMEGGTVSEVIESGVDGFDVGDYVVCRAGWQTHLVSDGRGVRKIDPKIAPLSTGLATSVANAMALTNYFNAQGGIDGPHGTVHVTIGGNMGSVKRAAQDPIFWVHHAQIDRLWNLWLAQGGRSSPVNDAAWRNSRVSTRSWTRPASPIPTARSTSHGTTG